MTTPGGARREPSPQRGGCSCPYCDEEVMVAMAPFCASCGVALSYCDVCHVPVTADLKECPKCGTPLRKARDKK